MDVLWLILVIMNVYYRVYIYLVCFVRLKKEVVERGFGFFLLFFKEFVVEIFFWSVWSFVVIMRVWVGENGRVCGDDYME